MKLSIFVLLFSILVCNLDLATSHICGTSGEFKDAPGYQDDLEELLSALPETNNGFGFFRYTYGQANAVASCRGDMDPKSCMKCIANATRRLQRACPMKIEAADWYKGLCFLRYSNRSLDRGCNDHFVRSMFSLNNVSDSNYVEWTEALTGLLGELQMEAKNGGQLRKYASGNKPTSVNLTVYGTMQCNPDMSASQCNNCLAGATGQIIRLRSVKATIYKFCCVVRYDVDQFYNSTWYPGGPDPSASRTDFPLSR